MYGAHRQMDAALPDICGQRSLKRLGGGCPQNRAGRGAPYFDIQPITAW